MEDPVARRLVVARKTWDTLVELADKINAAKGVVLSACDVATMCVEEGLPLITARYAKPVRKARAKKKAKRR